MTRLTRSPLGRLARLWPLAFWLAVWALASDRLANPVLLVSPLAVLERLGELVVAAEFWTTLMRSARQILLGFAIGVAIGSQLAVLASRSTIVRQLFAPLLLIARAVPVASIILLLLVWLSAARLAIAVVLLMVVPIVYSNLSAGIAALDPELTEVARVYHVGRRRRLIDLYLPQLTPYLLPALRASLGFAFKSGIAAEVIAIPQRTIGEQLYQAKIFLDTRDLLAWTLVIIALSYLFEHGLAWLVARLMGRLERAQPRAWRLSETGAVPPPTVELRRRTWPTASASSSRASR